MKSRQLKAINCLMLNAYSLIPIVSCLLLFHCTTQDTKLKQYKVQGEELYLKYCSNCHQVSGKGLGLVYPPLDVSDFVDDNPEAVICLMENGIKGEIVVNGESFNQPMPGMPQLTDLEIAEIATYLYNSWDREEGIIEVNDVTAIIRKCK